MKTGRRMGKCVVLCVAFLGMLQSTAFAGPSSSFQPDSVPGIDYYRPDEFFRLEKNPETLKEYFPEMADINAHTFSDLQRFSWSMAHRGISFGVGFNPNFSNYFDLYGNRIGINPGEPPAIFGYNERAEVGKFHFPTHDSVHMYIGQIGPRLKDLKDPKLARQRLINVLLRTEGLASGWTSWDHVQRYWEWRNKTVERHDEAQFKKYNSGVWFLGPISRADFADFVMSNTVGDFKLNYTTTVENINYEHFLNRKEAQVPQVLDIQRSVGTALKSYLGLQNPKWSQAIEKFLMKYAQIPVALSVALNSYFRSGTGYKGFLRYSEIQADFYLQPWYVEWADRFQIGDDLDTAEKEVERKFQDFKAGRFAHEVVAPAPGITEMMQLRSDIADLGRKLIELKHLSNRPEAADVYTAQDQNDIEEILSKITKLHDVVLAAGRANRPLHLGVVLQNQRVHRDFISQIALRFPVAKYLPYYLRLPHADYSQFWTDPTAVVMPRPFDLTTFLSSKGIAGKAQEYALSKEKIRDQGKNPYFPTDLVDGSITATNDRLAAEYLNVQLNAKADQFVSPSNLGYLDKIRAFQALLETQIDRVYLPQLLESDKLTFADRKILFEQVKTFQAVFATKCKELEVLYKAVFENLDRDPIKKSSLFQTEANLAIASQSVLSSMWTILNQVAQGKSLDGLRAATEKMQTVTEQLHANDKEVSFGNLDYFRLLLPIKGKTAGAACSYLTRFCLLNENISGYIQSEKLDKTMLRKGTNLVIEGSAGVDFNELPRNAVIILVSNHDYGIMDGRMINKVSASLGVRKTMTLLDTDVYPHLKVRDLKDNGIYARSEKFYSKLLSQAEQFTDGKMSLNIFPEGVVQYWASQFPRTAKWGAFAYARRLAKDLKGKKPVYLVEIKSNALNYMTDPNPQDLVAKVQKPVLVPDTPMTDSDSWVSEQRERFERSANETRARKQIDLVDRGLVSGTNVARSAGVTDYKSATDYMKALTAKKMAQAPHRQVQILCRQALNQ